MRATLDHTDPTSTPAPDGSMTAVVHDAWGDDPHSVLRIGRVPRPSVGDDGVLVHVAAVGIDRGTVHCMDGTPYAMRLAFGIRSPRRMNPARAFAGTVVAVGSSVEGFSPGDDVHGSCHDALAEYAVADPGKLAHVPPGLSPAQAAAAPISGVTALQAVRKAGIVAGDRVLVLGASGGVGSYAVQIADALGAEVTGVCRGSKADFVRSLGARHVVDHERDDALDGTVRYDAILDIGGTPTLRQLRRALIPNGTAIIVGGETGGRWLGGFDRGFRAAALSPFVSQKLAVLVSTENAADLDALGRLLTTGEVVPAIERTYPLSEVADAIEHVQDGRARGKVVVTL